MEKWLSFIVPVYNVEDYLSECVDSLLNQDVPSELYEISGLLTAMISLLPACCLVFMRRPAKAIWTC